MSNNKPDDESADSQLESEQQPASLPVIPHERDYLSHVFASPLKCLRVIEGRSVEITTLDGVRVVEAITELRLTDAVAD